MKILAIISQKGGVGKTTVATSLAVAAELAGQRVALFDLDDQASAAFWGGLREKRGIVTPVIRDVKMALLERTLSGRGMPRRRSSHFRLPPGSGRGDHSGQPCRLCPNPNQDRYSRYPLDALHRGPDAEHQQTVVRGVDILSPNWGRGRSGASADCRIGGELAPVEIHQRKAYARAQQDGQVNRGRRS